MKECVKDHSNVFDCVSWFDCVNWFDYVNERVVCGRHSSAIVPLNILRGPNDDPWYESSVITYAETLTKASGKMHGSVLP